MTHNISILLDSLIFTSGGDHTQTQDTRVGGCNSYLQMWLPETCLKFKIMQMSLKSQNNDGILWHFHAKCKIRLLIPIGCMMSVCQYESHIVHNIYWLQVRAKWVIKKMLNSASVDLRGSLRLFQELIWSAVSISYSYKKSWQHWIPHSNAEWSYQYNVHAINQHALLKINIQKILNNDLQIIILHSQNIATN